MRKLQLHISPRYRATVPHRWRLPWATTEAQVLHDHLAGLVGPRTIGRLIAYRLAPLTPDARRAVVARLSLAGTDAAVLAAARSTLADIEAVDIVAGAA